MKIRSGFVANSSSASFIINWRFKSFGKDINIIEALSKMYCITVKEDGKFDWENTWNKDIRPIIDDIINNTVKNKNESFTTCFWTSMMNMADDFGDSAKSLAISLLTDDDFELIDVKVEKDS